jgi:hypothetical protein
LILPRGSKSWSSSLLLIEGMPSRAELSANC